MKLPPLPKDRNWSPETWRAGLDEAVMRNTLSVYNSWAEWSVRPFEHASEKYHIAHATTLLDAGIVKPVVSEAAAVWETAYKAFNSAYVTDEMGMKNAIAVIDAALKRARMEGKT